MDSTGTRLIPLSGKRGVGKFAIVDESDYEWLSQRTWRLSKRGYPTASVTFEPGVKRSTPMHRLLVDLPPGLVTDHINRDKLDNRRSNLRAVTRKENRLNSPQSSPDPKVRRAALGWDNPSKPHGGRWAGGRRVRHNFPVGCSVWSERRHSRVRWRGCIDANTDRLYITTCDSEAEAVSAVRSLYIERYGSLPE